MTFSRTTLTAIGATVLLTLDAAGALVFARSPADLATFLAYALVGTYLILRRPRNAVGWLLIATCWMLVATSADLSATDRDRMARGTAGIAIEIRAWAGGALSGLTFLCYAALAFVFPSGGLPPGRAGRVIACVLVGTALLSAAPGFLMTTIPLSLPDGSTEIQVPNPFLVFPLFNERTGPADAVVAILTVALPILVLGGAVAHTVRRYRRSTGVVRLQLRWLMAAVAFVILAVLYGLAVFITLGPEMALVGWTPALLAYPTVPIAVGMAVMRYRLFDIDRIVSRTIGWLVLTAILGAVFAGGIVLLSSLLAPLVGGNTVAVAGSSLLAAVLFQPLRQRVQNAVDQRFDRARIDGDRIATAFAERMRDEVDLGSLIGTLTTTVEGAIRPVGTTVWLRSTERVDPRGAS